MTTRERLHRLIDELPDSRLDGALRALSDDDAVLAAFRDAPEDDEEWTEEDEAAVREADADFAAGRTVPLEHLERKYDGE